MNVTETRDAKSAPQRDAGDPLRSRVRLDGEEINGFRGFLDTFSVLYPQLQAMDLRDDTTSLGVPVFMVNGEHGARGREVLATEWFATVEAPLEKAVVFDGAGHRSHFDRPDLFADFMRSVVLELGREGER